MSHIADSSLPYCGIQGICALLDRCLSRGGDPGHALHAHVRDGLWLLDYTLARLHSLPSVHAAVSTRADDVRSLPANLRPRALAQLLLAVREAALVHAASLMQHEHVPFDAPIDSFDEHLAQGFVIASVSVKTYFHTGRCR